jgi:cytochrome b561
MSASVPQVHEVYDSRSVALHWITAFLVLAQWLGAHTIDWFPRGPLRVDARSTHILIGVVLLVIIVFRIVWRLTHAQRPAPVGPKAIRTVAPAVHWALYGVVIAVLAAGVVNVLVRGDSIFGLFKVPAFHPGDKVLRDQVGSIHEVLANILLVVAGLHAVSALIHSWVSRDAVLMRMIPALRREKDGRV